MNNQLKLNNMITEEIKGANPGEAHEKKQGKCDWHKEEFYPSGGFHCPNCCDQCNPQTNPLLEGFQTAGYKRQHGTAEVEKLISKGVAI